MLQWPSSWGPLRPACLLSMDSAMADGLALEPTSLGKQRQWAWAEGAWAVMKLHQGLSHLHGWRCALEQGYSELFQAGATGQVSATHINWSLVVDCLGGGTWPWRSSAVLWDGEDRGVVLGPWLWPSARNRGDSVRSRRLGPEDGVGAGPHRLMAFPHLKTRCDCL